MVMDKSHLLQQLDIASDSRIYLHHLKLILWGRALDFTCQAQSAEGIKQTFSLTFLDCRDMRWQLYSHIPSEETIQFPVTELVNFRIGRDQHRSACHILTEHFGLSLYYGEMKILSVSR